ncbi:MAG: acyl-CoA thioesterase [Candidatus Nanopelagicales bacterium]|jgi:acyl-CoA thioester hydrolase
MTVLITQVYRRFSDLDPLGHVNNVVFLDYLQEARLRVFLQLDYFEILEFIQVMVHQSIDFRHPLMYSTEPLTIEVWVSSIGNTSYSMKYRILSEKGELCAEAESVMVCFDKDKAVPIPEKLRTALQSILEVE